MNSYKQLLQHYESCFEKYGDTHLGVDWPNQEDAIKRHLIMLDVIKKTRPITLLDFGCGAGHLYHTITNSGKKETIQYTGLDLSKKMIEYCQTKYPSVQFYCMDLLENPDTIGPFDYAIINGVFTEKRELTFEEMWSFFTKLLVKIFPLATEGIAFNVMSKHVDWERDDLFHVPLDLLTDFLCKNLSRNFVIRNDYGLYENTVYVYKQPTIKKL